ncbi:hypothetical protein [Halothiobacillus sp.]|uniref:hypothetical protein n=1 Tax=Halothiobacillus sp. TaxID=1891311 RepID=UPI002AD3E35F|nr:hypothetical protein [Halothiobacillus sp.]
MPELLKYQWVVHRLEDSRELRELIINLTAGIRRLIIALWIGAQRLALERSGDDGLRLEDIKEAGAYYLAPVRPAVEALKSGDPKLMSKYEDLFRVDDEFWFQFWAR